MRQKQKLKVHYVGGVHHEGSSFSRYNALSKIYSEVSLLDTSPTHSIIGRLKTKFIRRFGLYMDKKIIETIAIKEPNIVWFDKPTMISNLGVSEIIAKHSEKVIVAHITDDINTIKRYDPEIEKKLSQFDAVFTPNKFNIKEYPEIRLVYNELGYDAEMYKPLKTTPNILRKTLSFVGHFEPSYEKELIKISNLLKDTEFNLAIYGTGWWRAKDLINRKDVRVQSGWQSLDQLKMIYTESVAGIGLYSAINRNQTSGRIFEIPALKVPLVTIENPVIKHFLGGNYININSFDSPAKFLQSLRSKDYLRDLSNNAIECMAHTKCTWQEKMDECVEHIDQILATKLKTTSK